jgi:hypothetical protein
VYEADAEINDRLQKIINCYRSTRIPYGNGFRYPHYNFVLKKISSQTGENGRTVHLYLDALENAAADVFGLPRYGDPDEALLQDVETFIGLYNAIMNVSVGDNRTPLSRRRRRAFKQIMSEMGKDLSTVQRYWKTFRRAAQTIKACGNI